MVTPPLPNDALGVSARRRPTGALLLAGALLLQAAMVTVIPPLWLVAEATVLLLLIIAVRAPRTVVLATLAFLAVSGLIRRATGSYVTQLDPLILAAPLLALTCLVSAFRGGYRAQRTPLSTAVTAMLALGVIYVVNPLQGNLEVGIVGAGLFVGPMVWFFIGQLLGDKETLRRVRQILLVTTIIVAAYGIKQTLFGFTGFEERWIAIRGASYHSLDIRGNTRPFSTFASGAEYGFFLALGAILLAASSSSRHRLLRAIAIAALLSACLYSGTRSILIAGVMGVMIGLLLGRRRSLASSGAIAVVGLLGLLALLRVVPPATGNSTADELRNRVVGGLTDPLNSKNSTLGIHVNSFGEGLKSGITNPLGSGAGVTNLAGRRLGSQSVSAEHDLPNVLLAYGIPGGLVLIALFVQVLRRVDQCARRGRRDLIGPAVFMLALFGQWFAGELYAVTAIGWFFLGSLDGQIGRSESEGLALESAESVQDRMAV